MHAVPRELVTVPFTGDDSLESLYVAHYRDLVRLVSGLLDDNETCEEVVQDAFASLLRGGRPRAGREAAYLRSAVLNGARSQMRKRRVRRRHLASVADETEPTPTGSPEDAAVQHIEHQRVLEAVRALPRRQCEVLLLRFQAELSEAEIADTLGISTGSVKTHASRGLAAVRARLDEDDVR